MRVHSARHSLAARRCFPAKGSCDRPGIESDELLAFVHSRAGALAFRARDCVSLRAAFQWLAGVTAVIGLMATAAMRADGRPSIAFVPLDDRPVTLQLPVMLGAIAGVDVVVPPRAIVGRYLEPGMPDAILGWLSSDATRDAFASVVSTDMIAYGGLVASRTPSVPQGLAITRLRTLATTRATRASQRFELFGTIMRLAPTGVPKLGAAATYFAAGPAVEAITAYANLPDPPGTDAERAKAAQLRAQIGAPLLDAYLATRARNRNVDQFVLQQLAQGDYDRVVLGQDDAGPQGLHIADVRALRSFAARWGLRDRSSIEPGADELGMALVARALAVHIGWTPSVHVTYSRANGGAVNDPLEFAPIDTTVDNLIRSCGARRVGAGGEIELFVRITGTSPSDESAFVDGIAQATAAGTLTAIADLTFLDGSMEEQRALVETLVARKLAGTVAAFASWNTTANTVGTALPEAIAVGAGRRSGTYDKTMHAQFAIDRYADDYIFHDFVRPQLNRRLTEEGVSDHTYLLPDAASRTASLNRKRLWPLVLDLIQQIAPNYGNAGLTITLPWDRTFETELDVRLSPGGPHPH